MKLVFSYLMSDKQGMINRNIYLIICNNFSYTRSKNLCKSIYRYVCSRHNRWVIDYAHNEINISDEQYHSLPRLFHLDDYEKCLSSRRSVYCLGTFNLLPYRNDGLYDVLQVNILVIVFLVTLLTYNQKYVVKCL